MIQMTLDDALKARDREMENIAHNADVLKPFSEMAAEFVLDYLRQHGPTSGEVLTEQCERAGIYAHDSRAFGPVYAKLARSRQIKRVGFCQRRRGHGTAGGSIWALWEGAED